MGKSRAARALMTCLRCACALAACSAGDLGENTGESSENAGMSELLLLLDLLPALLLPLALLPLTVLGVAVLSGGGALSSRIERCCCCGGGWRSFWGSCTSGVKSALGRR